MIRTLLSNTKQRRKHGIKTVLWGMSFIVLLVFFVSVSTVESSVMVAPTRVTFEEGERSATVRLINRGDEQKTYRVVFQRRKMTEEGLETVEVPESRDRRLEENLAQDLIRYSPRQVTLPPETTQVVRLQVRKPADLQEGEYRSRLVFQEVPEEAPDAEIPDDEVGVQLRAIYGVGIPVIVRHGETWAEAELSDLKLEEKNDQPQLSLNINRSGNRSVYGNFEVTHISEEGKKTTVGRVKGVAVYTDIEQRRRDITLNAADKVDLKNGRLHVSYRRPPEKGGHLLAEEELEI